MSVIYLPMLARCVEGRGDLLLVDPSQPANWYGQAFSPTVVPCRNAMLPANFGGWLNDDGPHRCRRHGDFILK
jgi:hypothetical protein